MRFPSIAENQKNTIEIRKKIVEPFYEKVVFHTVYR